MFNSTFIQLAFQEPTALIFKVVHTLLYVLGSLCPHKRLYQFQKVKYILSIPNTGNLHIIYWTMLHIELSHPNQLKLGKPCFPLETTTNQTKTVPTSSQLLHNQTRPNSVCNHISTQLEDSFKKIGSPPPLPKKTQIFQNFILNQF